MDFILQLERYSNQLFAHGKTLAAKAGWPYEYRQGSFRKEAWANEIIRRDDVRLHYHSLATAI